MPTRSGTVPPEVTAAFQAGLFAVPSTGGLTTSGAQQQDWVVPIIMVSFTDQPLTFTPSEFEFALFDSLGQTPTGSVYDYYRWLSGNRIHVTGRVVAVVQLPHDKSYYGNNAWGLNLTGFPENDAGAVLNALAACDAQVNWAPYDVNRDGFVDMLWVLHSGLPGEATVSRDNLWSITSRLTSWPGAGSYQTNDPVPGSPLLKIRVDRFSIVPEFSAIWPGRRSEIGVFCHEFGHALGLPDLYDTRQLGVSGNIGLGNWSLMATGGYGGDTQSPEYPTHMSAWPMLFLGLSETVRPTADSLITLGAIERGAPIVELWFQGESNPEHFLIENRQREGFDRNLPNEGLIVYQVDDAAIGLGLPSNRVIGGPDDAMRLIQADNRRDLENGSNRGDPSDPFPGSMGLTRIDDDTSPSLRTFAGAVTNLALTNIAPVGDDMRMLAQVQAPGWLPAEEHSMGGFQPVASFGPATRAVRHADGTLCFVGSEIINGRAQVVLRTKTRGETWAPPVTVSQSPGQAFDPTIAAIPGGDIAVVWSDTRHGARELYFRSWLHGVWTPERRLTDLPGDSRSPCLGADGLGGMHLAWQYNESGSVRVQFMYFTYYSPFGDPRPVTAPGELPDAPSLAVDARGSSYVVWSDRATYPSPAIWYAHFHPDSGVSVRRRVFDTGGLPQNGPQAVVDTAGALNLLWQVASASGNEIHYQRRLAAFPPMPRDTIIELRGESVQDPMLAADPQGGLHLVMALSQTQQQIRYKNWQPGRGWDRVSTEVTQIGDGSAVRPTVLAASPGYVTVLYTGYPGGAPQFMERRREYGPSPLTAVASPVPTRAARLVLGRNPLPAGTGLTVRGSVEPGPGDRLDLLDLNGRLVASSAVERSGDAWLARWSGQETGAWRSGIYWVRSRATGAVARLVVLR